MICRRRCSTQSLARHRWHECCWEERRWWRRHSWGSRTPPKIPAAVSRGNCRRPTRRAQSAKNLTACLKGWWFSHCLFEAPDVWDCVHCDRYLPDTIDQLSVVLHRSRPALRRTKVRDGRPVQQNAHLGTAWDIQKRRNTSPFQVLWSRSHDTLLTGRSVVHQPYFHHLDPKIALCSYLQVQCRCWARFGTRRRTADSRKVQTAFFISHLWSEMLMEAMIRETATDSPMKKFRIDSAQKCKQKPILNAPASLDFPAWIPSFVAHFGLSQQTLVFYTCTCLVLKSLWNLPVYRVWNFQQMNNSPLLLM